MKLKKIFILKSYKVLVASRCWLYFYIAVQHSSNIAFTRNICNEIQILNKFWLCIRNTYNGMSMLPKYAQQIRKIFLPILIQYQQNENTPVLRNYFVLILRRYSQLRQYQLLIFSTREILIFYENSHCILSNPSIYIKK